MGYRKYLKKLYQKPKKSMEQDQTFKDVWVERKKRWRRGPSIARQEKPVRVDRARGLGYKSKQGFIIIRSRIRRGSMRKSRPISGRRPKRMGVNKLTSRKSIQRMAEERTAKKYPNLEVLGSYLLVEDGKYKWFEVILVDPNHPAIKSDKDMAWVCGKQHRGRVFRGLTSAGKSGRGLRNKGRGAEKI
ncbi:MAG: 50S ribosomal protein L15e, partial [Candidatus Altiarchaeales archaeon]|nr:50S ribosomal protein L15e [Candidatus Altiarchaeales archaeon]